MRVHHNSFIGNAAKAAAKRLGHFEVMPGLKFQHDGTMWEVRAVNNEVTPAGLRTYYAVDPVQSSAPLTIPLPKVPEWTRLDVKFMNRPDASYTFRNGEWRLDTAKEKDGHAKDASIYTDAARWADPAPAEWKPDTVTVTTEEPKPDPRPIGVYGQELVIPLMLVEKTEAWFPANGQVGTMLVKARVSTKALHQIKEAHDAYVLKNGTPKPEAKTIKVGSGGGAGGGSEPITNVMERAQADAMAAELGAIRAVLRATGHTSNGKPLDRLVDAAIDRERTTLVALVDSIRAALSDHGYEDSGMPVPALVRVAIEDMSVKLAKAGDKAGETSKEASRLHGLAAHYKESSRKWEKRAMDLEARITAINDKVSEEYMAAEIIPF